MITVERANTADLEILLGWIESERELRQWSAHALSNPPTFEALKAVLKAQDVMSFKAVQDGKMIGYADFARVNPKNGTATLCRVLVPKAMRGQNVARKMLERMCAIAFSELNLRRLDLLVFEYNESAIKLYQNLGFKQEGRLREWLHFNDEYWDAIQMGLLKREFKNV